MTFHTFSDCLDDSIWFLSHHHHDAWNGTLPAHHVFVFNLGPVELKPVSQSQDWPFARTTWGHVPAALEGHKQLWQLYDNFMIIVNQDDLCFGCCPGLKWVKSISGIVQFTSRPAIVEDCDLIRSDEHHGNQETHGGGWSKSVFFSLKCVRLESVLLLLLRPLLYDCFKVPWRRSASHSRQFCSIYKRPLETLKS